MNTTQTGLVRQLRRLVAGPSADTLSDQQLLAQFVTRQDQASFALLVSRHGPMVLSVCLRVLRQTQDAEDAFQATFLVLAQKAATIRKRESVGCFLHGVPYRTAAKLRAQIIHRVAQERRLPARSDASPAEDITWRELRSVLDEELRKLPEPYRAPLVLCYLEGATQDEAARRLGWSLGTFRRRLEQGRNRLGRRLARRGLTLSATLCAPFLSGVSNSAALPAVLTNITIRAGVRLAVGESVDFLVPEHIAALAERTGSTFLTGKLKAIAAFVLVTSLAASGLLAHQVIGKGAAPSGVAEKPSLPSQQASDASPPATLEQMVVVRGRVLGPDGKPMNGATVYVSTYTDKDKTDPNVRAQTGADGRFRFPIRRAEADGDKMVAAVAPGYGPDWVSLKQANGDKELSLRLVSDGVAVRARVLDLEGRPIARAAVRLLRLRKMPDEDLAAWLKELETHSTKPDALGQIEVRYERIMSSVWGVLGAPRSVTTDADGRFALSGFGVNRIVDLDIEGPGIESRNVTVILRPGLKGLPPDMHGPSFDLLAAPSKPIRGTIREKDTAKPLAGVRVFCSPSKKPAEVFTDKEGRFEFAGVGKSEQYWLTAEHPEARYVFTIKNVQDTLNLEPIAVDLELGRAFPLRIRVTDKETGKPVPAVIQYAAAPGNPNLKNYPLFFNSILKTEETDQTGCCNLIALPGRGFLAVRAQEDRFTAARGAGLEEKSLFVLRYSWPPPSVDLFHAIVPIDPSAEESKSRSLDIVLTPGRRVSGSVIGPDGRGLSGARVAGSRSLYPLDREPALSESRFTVYGLEPDKPRTLVFWHKQKGLARVVVIRKDDKTPLTVRLQSRGTAIGRLVDATGRPRQGIEVIPQMGGKQAVPLSPSWTFFLENDLRNAVLPARVLTDAMGRFRIEGLIPGLRYDLDFRSGKGVWRKVRGVLCRSGATVNLGEIKDE